MDAAHLEQVLTDPAVIGPLLAVWEARCRARCALVDRFPSPPAEVPALVADGEASGPVQAGW